jgi:hypothetical protein
MSCGLLQIPSLWRILIVALLSLQCRSSDPASDNASTKKGEALVNSIGKVLPLDAAPLHPLSGGRTVAGRARTMGANSVQEKAEDVRMRR